MHSGDYRAHVVPVKHSAELVASINSLLGGVDVHDPAVVVVANKTVLSSNVVSDSVSKRFPYARKA
jgi:hypothetical protein